MRSLIALAMLLQCAPFVAAGGLPLGGNDVVLMLRMGYSSEDVTRDLRTKRFAGPLDPMLEDQLRHLNASAKLLADLKSGQFDATADQLKQAQEKTAAMSAPAAEVAREQPNALQNNALPNRPVSDVWSQPHPVRKTQAADHLTIIDLEVGQRLDLRQFGGPNMSIMVKQIDLSDVAVVFLDYDRMRGSGGGDRWTGYSYSYGPSGTLIKVKKEDRSVIYSWGRSKLVYLDAMDTALNHLKVGIISE